MSRGYCDSQPNGPCMRPALTVLFGLAVSAATGFAAAQPGPAASAKNGRELASQACPVGQAGMASMAEPGFPAPPAWPRPNTSVMSRRLATQARQANVCRGQPVRFAVR